MMAKSFHILRDKMSAGAKQQSEARAYEMLRAMALADLRQAMKMSQQQLAEKLSIKQAAVSKMENRTDMYISTLRRMVKAMGGELEITARFPDATITINQFEELEPGPAKKQ